MLEGIMAAQKIKPKECPPYLNEFFTYQRVVKIKAERTLESYYIDLRLFLRYVKAVNGDVKPDTPMNDIVISDVPLDYVRNFSKVFTTVFTVTSTLFPTIPQRTLTILKCMSIFRNF